MYRDLTYNEGLNGRRFKSFADAEVAPLASKHDSEQRIGQDLIKRLAQEGYLASCVTEERGGAGLDMISYGLLHEEMGRVCSSLRSMITVHDMVAITIARWGTRYQRDKWIAKLVAGEVIGAFAVTEGSAGSDLEGVESSVVSKDGNYVINGTKKWISFGQIADLFLILAKYEGQLACFLIERNTPGLSIGSINGMLGLRGSMLAELQFCNCVVPGENLVGRRGFGLNPIVAMALSLGRYGVAFGSVGIAQACIDACMQYTSYRRQFGVLLKEHQMIQHMISDMVSNVSAARLLCYQAGHYKQQQDPREVLAIASAKYFASRVAMKSASDAVQILGANGCSDSYPVERLFRDAKVMELIEGSNQIQQQMIAKLAFQDMERQLSERQSSVDGRLATVAISSHPGDFNYGRK